MTHILITVNVARRSEVVENDQKF